jgi:hypothetical protein
MQLENSLVRRVQGNGREGVELALKPLSMFQFVLFYGGRHAPSTRLADLLFCGPVGVSTRTTTQEGVNMRAGVCPSSWGMHFNFKFMLFSS